MEKIGCRHDNGIFAKTGKKILDSRILKFKMS